NAIVDIQSAVLWPCGAADALSCMMVSPTPVRLRAEQIGFESVYFVLAQYWPHQRLFIPNESVFYLYQYSI
ncbi:MAG: hypothetical protein AB7F51_09150, partial [Pseudorhodoplanes sp.]